MTLQKQLSEKATAALIFPDALREATMSQDVYSLVGVLSNEPLGSWLSSLLWTGCNHLAKFLPPSLDGAYKTKVKRKNSFGGISAQMRPSESEWCTGRVGKWPVLQVFQGQGVSWVVVV